MLANTPPWIQAALIGLGATALSDGWSWVLRRAWGVPSLDWAWVGRWIGHFTRGSFRHEHIARAAPIPAEQPLGWCAHYLIGAGLGMLFVPITGISWLQDPRPWPALCYGLLTVSLPFFVMQPAFGLGFAASAAPNPGAARLRSLMTHAVFGLSLFVSASLLAW